MIGWVMVPLRRYADFSGRSSRAEFWKWTLAFYVVIFVLIFLLIAATRVSSIAALILGIVTAVFVIGCIIPNIAITIRRLHDTNRSGWWLGANVVLNVVQRIAGMSENRPAIIITGLAGAILGIVLLVFFCLPGTTGENDYGSNPYDDADLEALAREFQ
jgi:uncharacterized membrane protein YhaH (DUF805 family)